jgi:hypothetical protein
MTVAVQEAILMNINVVAKLGLKNGNLVILRNDLSAFPGKVYIAPIQSGNLQVHWPKGNVLLDKSKHFLEGIPDHNTLVSLEKLT